MSNTVVFVSIPGLRELDLENLPTLKSIAERGSLKPLVPSFPCVTCPVQANLTTGVGPEVHGVIANGFYYRDKNEVLMWTGWNECIQAPQIWDLLHEKDPGITSAVWFPLLAKGAGADYICMPAPIHNPDGSETLWCYTKPTELYGELRDTFGHFPLMNFWGPMANIKSTDWIVDSAVLAAKKFQPRFSYIYIPHLDYAGQKSGPNSPQAAQAVVDLEDALSRLVRGYEDAGLGQITWVIASEYAINEVNEVSYPNRILRSLEMLQLEEEEGLEYLKTGHSKAWTMVDHQFAHVFVKDQNDIAACVEAFRHDPNIERVLVGEERAEFNLNHPLSGDIILLAKEHAWFAYYWWNDDTKAPKFARTVDIHQKPGYDPVELFIKMPEKQIPLDATLVKGSHGYPATDPSRHGVLISSAELVKDSYQDLDVTPLIMGMFN